MRQVEGRRRRWAVLGIAAVWTGCVPATGGWDVDALLRDASAVAAVEGQRIGDLVPHPAIQGGRLVLTACHFGRGAEIGVAPSSGSGPDEWTRRAVETVDAAVEGVSLGWVPGRTAGPEARAATAQDVRRHASAGSPSSRLQAKPA